MDATCWLDPGAHEDWVMTSIAEVPACCQKASADEDDQRGDIVLRAGRSGGFNDSVCRGLRVVGLFQQGLELVERNAVDSTIGTKQEAISGRDGELLGLGSGAPLFRADIPPQHVLK